MSLLDTVRLFLERRWTSSEVPNNTTTGRSPLKLVIFCVTVVIVVLCMTFNSVIELQYQSQLDRMAITAGLCQEHNVGPLQYYRYDRYEKCK